MEQFDEAELNHLLEAVQSEKRRIECDLHDRAVHIETLRVQRRAVAAYSSIETKILKMLDE